MPSTSQPSLLVRIMAKRCDVCPLCKYARAKPESRIGRAFAWHGKWCPFWRSWQRVYGESGSPQQSV